MLTSPGKNSSPLPVKTPVIEHVARLPPCICRRHPVAGLSARPSQLERRPRFRIRDSLITPVACAIGATSQSVPSPLWSLRLDVVRWILHARGGKTVAS